MTDKHQKALEVAQAALDNILWREKERIDRILEAAPNSLPDASCKIIADEALNKINEILNTERN